MNTKNNQRSKDTETRVEAALFALLAKKHISKISVREICDMAGITRTSFYFHYEDIYDLLHKAEHNVTIQIIPFLRDEDTGEVHITRESFIKIFRYIGENKTFYKYYFQNTNQEISSTLKNLREHINTDMAKHDELSENRQYHIAFFMGGLNSLIKQWLEQDCAASPEEMADILEAEYQPKLYGQRV